MSVTPKWKNSLKLTLVGGFNPSKNTSQNWIISLGRGEIKIFETTTQNRLAPENRGYHEIKVHLPTIHFVQRLRI